MITTVTVVSLSCNSSYFEIVSRKQIGQTVLHGPYVPGAGRVTRYKILGYVRPSLYLYCCTLHIASFFQTFPVALGRILFHYVCVSSVASPDRALPLDLINYYYYYYYYLTSFNYLSLTFSFLFCLHCLPALPCNTSGVVVL